MESIIKILILLCISASAFPKDNVIGRKYFQPFLGHVHQNANKDSSSLTIVQCSHSVKMLKTKHKINNWSYVQVGDDKGYIQDEFLGEKRPKCFQQKYPKYYLGLELDITEMYFWGRLNDQYLKGRSRIK
jgi:hypothetical protein